MTKNRITGMVNRLRVFRAVKAHMEATGDCPCASEIAPDLDLSARVVLRHMDALREADGLPLPIPAASTRKGRGMTEQFLGGLVGKPPGKNSMAAWAPVPVDRLIRGRR